MYILIQSVIYKLLFVSTMTAFVLPPLPYSETALAPTLSAKTLEFHHGKHQATYVNTLNKLIAGTPFENEDLVTIIKTSDGPIFNNAAQAWNHAFYFDQFSTHSTPIEGSLADSIAAQWGSVANFKTEFVNAGLTLFGSGWVWLAADNKGAISIIKESNAGNPLTKGLVPLLTFDVWEHAYYLDYQNLRADYLNNLWNILDWSVIENRYLNRK